MISSAKYTLFDLKVQSLIMAYSFFCVFGIITGKQEAHIKAQAQHDIFPSVVLLFALVE